MFQWFRSDFISVQDSFYKYHNEEELALAHTNLLDFDHPDAIDMPVFASVSFSYFD